MYVMNLKFAKCLYYINIFPNSWCNWIIWILNIIIHFSKTFALVELVTVGNNNKSDPLQKKFLLLFLFLQNSKILNLMTWKSWPLLAWVGSVGWSWLPLATTRVTSFCRRGRLPWNAWRKNTLWKPSNRNMSSVRKRLWWAAITSLLQSKQQI